MEIVQIPPIDIQPQGASRRVPLRRYSTCCVLREGAAMAAALIGSFAGGCMAGAGLSKGNRLAILGIAVLPPLFTCMLYKSIHRRNLPCWETAIKTMAYAANIAIGIAGFYIYSQDLADH